MRGAAPTAFRLEPLTHVGIEAEAEHVVVKSLAQAAAQEVMIRAYGVVELNVVMCKRNGSWRSQCDAVFLGMQTYRRVRRRREAMPVRRLDAAGREKLTHALERVDRVLCGLRREAIHQIRVHHDARIAERASHARYLFDGHAFLHEPEQSIRRHFEPAAHGDAAGCGEQTAQLEREGSLETNIAPPRDAEFLVDEALCECTHACRRRGLVDQVEAGLARLRDQRSNALHDDVLTRPIVTADVVERDVAERAFLPVAAVRQRNLVPAAVRPEAMHRVWHFHDGHVLTERQAVVRRNARVAWWNVMLGQIVLEYDFRALAHIRAHER